MEDYDSILREHGATGAIPEWQKQRELPNDFVPETDRETVLREHGATGAIPEWQRQRELPKDFVPETDRETVLREHGATGAIPEWQRQRELPKDFVSETDREAALREHGATGAIPEWQMPRVLPKDFVPETDREAALREHGATGAVSIGKEIFGTSDKNSMKVANEMAHAVSYENLINAIEELPHDTIVKVVEQRYRRVANFLDDRYGLDKDLVGKYLSFDLLFIKDLLQDKMNFFEPEINVTNKIGVENYQNIIGLLQGYEDKLSLLDTDIKLSQQGKSALSEIEELKKMAYDLCSELGYGQGTKKR